MATINPFDLLGDDDNDDPSRLIALHQQKIATLKAAAATVVAAEAPAKLPSKPLPPSKFVEEAKKDTGAALPRGGGRGGFGRGRGGRGRDFRSNGHENGYSGDGHGTVENGDLARHEERGRGSYGGPRQPYRGGRRGGFANGDAERDGGWRNSYANRDAEQDTERPPRRQFDRRGAYGRENGNIKKDETVPENTGKAFDGEADGMGKIEEKDSTHEKPDVGLVSEANKQEKEVAQDEVDKKENEDKEMTLDEYQKLLEEKRKALVAMKAEERKVDLDKEFQSMQQLSLKKGNNEVFIKLGADKDTGKKKEESSRDERIKKSVSINEFLKPADGERYFSPRGRRGRGLGDHVNPQGNFGGRSMSLTAAPAIESAGEFPPLK
ncbi:hypothetical protein Scep_008233 [Stephania cephalantha]|uniref:Hyaluronan/mRNA-binding protein domain-containing protein n=1 Tax=Stephania cephalantha TaxID=152367 RepID=A0AAP0KB94_9MAGN